MTQNMTLDAGHNREMIGRNNHAASFPPGPTIRSSSHPSRPLVGIPGLHLEEATTAFSRLKCLAEEKSADVV